MTLPHSSNCCISAKSFITPLHCLAFRTLLQFSLKSWTCCFLFFYSILQSFANTIVNSDTPRDRAARKYVSPSFGTLVAVLVQTQERVLHAIGFFYYFFLTMIARSSLFRNESCNLRKVSCLSCRHEVSRSCMPRQDYPTSGIIGLLCSSPYGTGKTETVC